MSTRKEVTKVLVPNGRSGLDLDAVLRRHIEKLLSERELSEKQLAAAIGVSQQNVNRFMNGGGTSLRFLSRFCTWSGVDPSVALGTAPSSPDIRSLIAQMARVATLEGQLDVARWLTDFAG